MNRLGVVLGTVGTLSLLAACSVSAGDYRDEAQKFIESDDVADQLDLAFTEAACDEPASTDPDTEFRCTATGADGVAYAFTVTISGKAKFTLNAPEAVG